MSIQSKFHSDLFDGAIVTAVTLHCDRPRRMEIVEYCGSYTDGTAACYVHLLDDGLSTSYEVLWPGWERAPEGALA